MIRKQKRKQFLDGLSVLRKKPDCFDFSLAKYVLKNKRGSVLLSSKGRQEKFFTFDSKLYFTQEELQKIQKGERVSRLVGMIDSVAQREFSGIPKYKVKYVWDSQEIYLDIKKRYASAGNYFFDLARGSVQGLSVARMWNVSIVGAVIFGMFLMTMIYRYLGQGVMAGTVQENSLSKTASMAQLAEEDDINEMIDTEYITQIIGEHQEKISQTEDQLALEKEIREMTSGYPIEKMASEIAKKDRIVAAFLVAIAKKESSWGEHVPVYKGQDCFNYWGYRGIREKMGTGGHTCFNSPKDAVDTVAKRIEFLVSNEKLNTPGKMVVWKCGYDCSWDNKKAVNKWISDVDMYFRKLNKEDGKKKKI